MIACKCKMNTCDYSKISNIVRYSRKWISTFFHPCYWRLLIGSENQSIGAWSSNHCILQTTCIFPYFQITLGPNVVHVVLIYPIQVLVLYSYPCVFNFSPPLTYYFLGEYAEAADEGRHSSMAQHYYEVKSWHFCVSSDLLTICNVDALFQLLVEIWNQNFMRKQSCITPSGVHGMLKTINPSFRGYQQQVSLYMNCHLHGEVF